MSVEPFPTPEPSAADRWKIGEANAQAIEATRPAWAKAVIVAELEESRCDSMTDYYATATMRRVVLAWSKHTRDLFPELRHAAATFPDTAHMGPECDIYRARVILGADVVTMGSAYYKGSNSHWHSELFEESEKYGRGKRFTRLAEAQAFISSAGAPEPISFQTEAGSQLVTFEWTISRESLEHREKYSMGHGFYLSDSGTYGSGWRVIKRNKVDGHTNLENRIGTSRRAEAPAPVTADGITVSLNAEKHGVELRFPAKPDDMTRDALKAHGWRWSRFSSCWYQQDTPAARAYAAHLAGLPAIE